MTANSLDVETLEVRVIAWDTRGAVAVVGGVRVRIRVRRPGSWWVCDLHGRALNDPDHCRHTRALAQAPALPNRSKGMS